MGYRNLGLVILLLMLLTGCTKEDLRNSIPYEVILENQFSYWEEEKIPEQYSVLKTETAWNNFLSEIENFDPPRAELLRNLEFNFSNDILIIIIGKYNNNCCSKISVNGVYKNNTDIVVHYKESGPGGATMVSQAYTILKISGQDTH